jgi:hypothetical protein
MGEVGDFSEFQSPLRHDILEYQCWKIAVHEFRTVLKIKFAPGHIRHFFDRNVGRRRVRHIID